MSQARLTQRSSSSRMTSESVTPLASALACAASQSGSSMRMDRSFVGMSGVAFEEVGDDLVGFGGAVEVVGFADDPVVRVDNLEGYAHNLIVGDFDCVGSHFDPFPLGSCIYRIARRVCTGKGFSRKKGPSRVFERSHVGDLQ